MAKTFTNSSNCSRAAKVALGKNAKRGVHFTIDAVDGGFTWAAIEGAPAVMNLSLAPYVDATTLAKAQECAAFIADSPRRAAEPAKAKTAAVKKSAKPKKAAPEGRRDGTKRAQLIEMLQRKTGASKQEIMDKFGWSDNTARGMLSNMITSEKATSEKPAARAVAFTGSRASRVTATTTGSGAIRCRLLCLRAVLAAA